ncbi:MAG: Ig-like domain-containing protein [Spirochaetes bacterium]|nr:Ig-like domain-containing protein [Spirochaetota bacterium]
MQRLLIACYCALIALTAATGCDSETASIFDFGEFTVSASVPASGQSGVDPDASVELYFSEDADILDVERNFSLTGTSGKVEGSFSWTSRRAMRFTPRYQLARSRRYSVELPTTVRSQGGRSLSRGFLSDFFVGDYAANPGVAASTPAHVTGGNVIDPSALTELTFTFTRPMDSMKTQAAFSLSPYVSGTFSWSPDATILTYRLTATLDYGRTYSARIGSAAEDTGGNAMARDFLLVLVAGDDTTPPQVLGMNDNGTAAYWNTAESGIENSVGTSVSSIYVAFSEAMDKERVESAFSITPAVDGHITWPSDAMLCYHLDESLQAEQSYQITVDTGAEDIHSLHLQEPCSVIVRTTAATAKHVAIGEVRGSADGAMLPAAADYLFSGSAIPWPVMVPLYGNDSPNGMKYYFMIQFLRDGIPVAMDKTSLYGNYLVEKFSGDTTSPRVFDITWHDADTVAKVYVSGLLHKTLPDTSVLYRFTLSGGSGGIRDALGNTMADTFTFEFKEVQ